MYVTVRRAGSYVLAVLLLTGLMLVHTASAVEVPASADTPPAEPVEPGPVPPEPAPDADRVLAAPLVVVGVGGLSWAEVTPERTPTVWALLQGGAAAAAVTVYTSGQPACPLGGWLSLSAGRASPSSRFGGLCLSLPPVSPAGSDAAGSAGRVTVPGWTQLAAEQADSRYSPKIGTLGSALAAADVCATAVGPGAALALADRAGEVARYLPVVAPGAFDCPVTVVDVGTTSVLEDLDGAVLPVDVRIATVLELVPDDATVLLTSVATTVGQGLEMGIAIASGPGVTSDLMTTASTRWSGVVRLLDIPPSVIDAVGATEPPDFQGSPLVLAGARGDVTSTVLELGDVTVVDQALRTTSGPLTTALSVAALVLLGVVWWRPATGGVGTSASARPRRVRRGAQAVALVVAVIPVSAYLVTLLRWWESSDPRTSLALSIGAIALGLAGATALLHWGTGLPVVPVVAMLSAGVMAADAVAGSPLHRGSPFGPSPLLGGRYYGFGNTTYALFAVYALVLAAALAARFAARERRRLALLTVAIVGAVAVIVDIWPSWGADVGGGLALVPAFVVLGLGAAGLAVTRGRAVASVGAGLGIVSAVSLLDWLRPVESRSHAGRFVQQVLDGDAGAIVARKAYYAVTSLQRGPAAWVTLLVLVLATVAVTRPDRFAPAALRAGLREHPLLRTTIASVLVGLTLGSLVNDYGIRIATVGAIAGVPLLALVCLQLGQRRSPERTVPRSTTVATSPKTISASVPDSTPPMSAPVKSALRNRTPTR